MDIRQLALIVAGIALLIYLLYIAGYAQIRLKRAVLYIGARGNAYRNYHKAKVAACSGSVRRVIYLRENTVYVFSFRSAVSKGNITVELLDAKKHPVLTLDQHNKTGTVSPGSKSRYYLAIRFDKAHGDYELTWNECCK